jgi:hypothetical protein
MGLPNRIPQTNVLPFPLARVEEDGSSQLEESQGGDYRAGVTERSAAHTLQRPAILEGYLLVPLPGDDKRAILGLRFLIAALVLFAVLQSLSMTAVLWLGRSDIASSALVGASSKHDAEVIITLPAISMPTMLKANAGDSTPFPVAIDGTDPVEGGGAIVISRLPQGSSFSAGTPDGDTTWKLAPGEIDNLHLVLPKTLREETALMIQLIASDGHVISDAATIIEVTNLSEANIPVHRIRTQVVPGHVEDQPSQVPEAMDAEAELVTQARALRSDPVPLPTRHPGPR